MKTRTARRPSARRRARPSSPGCFRPPRASTFSPRSTGRRRRSATRCPSSSTSWPTATGPWGRARCSTRTRTPNLSTNTAGPWAVSARFRRRNSACPRCTPCGTGGPFPGGMRTCRTTRLRPGRRTGSRRTTGGPSCCLWASSGPTSPCMRRRNGLTCIRAARSSSPKPGRTSTTTFPATRGSFRMPPPRRATTMWCPWANGSTACRPILPVSALWTPAWAACWTRCARGRMRTTRWWRCGATMGSTWATDCAGASGRCGRRRRGRP